MRLSDEDYNTCVKKAVPDNHHTWPTNRDVASAAYALGVERARNTPDAATRAVIERLVDAQAQSSAIIADAQAILTRYLVPDGITHEQAIHELLGLLDGPVQRDAKLSTSDAIAEASKLLEDDGWIRVEDALPVVPPLYAEVAIWMVDSRFPNPIRKTFRVTDKALHQYITHWQYDIQPKPPKG